MDVSSSPRYQFGPFVLDPMKRYLLRAGTPVPLAPKAIDTLLALVERRGQIVAKDELLSSIWPDTFVEEKNLTVCVSQIRKGLGEGPGDNEFIVTVPGKGYRFVAEVTVLSPPVEPPAETAPSAPPSASKPPRVAILAALATLAALIALGLWWWAGRTQPPNTLAVLIFKDLAPGAGYEYLGLGLADSLVTRLSRVPGLIMRPINAVLPLSNLDSVEAGKRTYAVSVLEGTLRINGDRLRVSVRLVSTRSGESLWAESFYAEVKDLFTVEDSIASRVADALVPRLGGGDRKQVEKHETDNAEAHRFYMKGRHLRAVNLTRHSLLEAARNFQAAVKLDPAYGLGHAALAEVTALNGLYYLPPSETMPQARESARLAVSLDPDQSDCHCADAVVKMLANLDWSGADRSFRKTLELNPANAMCADWYAMLLANQGKIEEATTYLHVAMKVSPAELASFVDFGVNDYYSRRYERAITRLVSTLDRDPGYYVGLVEIGRAYSLAGYHDRAIESFEKARKVEDVPWVAICHSWALARAGQTDRARALLRETEASKDYVSPVARAIAWSALGDRSTAMTLLEKAWQDRHPLLLILKMDPMFDPVRQDPRFQTLLTNLQM